jgi:hypothetical protein
MEIQARYRQATTDEVAYYHKVLYPLQDQVFAIARVYDEKLYLTGGTALARFHFHHRLSEDLDFFTTTDDLKLIANDLRLRLIEAGYTVETEKLDLYFARFYIVQPDATLKIEFAKEFNLVDPLEQTEYGIYINSLEDIGANKITAFEDRAAIKDIIDLYYITQQLPFDQLFLADRKQIPIAYEELLALHATGITGQALLTKAIPAATLSTFLSALVTATAAEIKKKELMRAANLDPLIRRLLWEFPPERRTINTFSVPVLRQRLAALPLPDRYALAKRLDRLTDPHTITQT